MTPEEIAKKAKERSENKKKKTEEYSLELDVLTTKAGTIVKPSFRNATIYMQTDKKLIGLFQFNDFAHTAETTKRPFWGKLGAYPKQVIDADVVNLRKYLADEYRVDFKKTNLDDAVTYIAGKNAYDPVHDYLTSLKWDGTPRLETWLIDYLGVEDNEYSRFVGRMTLAGACARIDKPGVKYDYMLILEGEQGIGKSEALKALGGQWFTEMSLTERSKDIVEKMQGAWIIEVPELAVFKKKEIESLKAFITMNEDKERLPYGHRSQMFPRRNIFIGTINPGSNGYLTDNTGNRRFLPVECTEIDPGKIAADRDQLWAEAWLYYQSKAPLYITKDIADKSMDMQRSREIEDSWQGSIENFVKDKDRVTSAEIYTDCLKGFLQNLDRVSQNRISDCLRKANWERKSIRVNGELVKGFMRNKDAIEIETTEDTPWSE